MKCTAVNLINRSEYNRRKPLNNVQQSIEPVYVTKGYHGYSFTFLQHHIPSPNKQPILTVNNLHLPEDVRALNSGYSLKKWSNKMPRLKSACSKKGTAVNRYPELDPEYDMSYDINNILECIDNDDIQEETDNNNEQSYEVHSDIEELLRKSAEIRRQEEKEGRRGRRKEEGSDEGRPEDKSRKRHKQRLKKTIKFSFSKPASPQTEQVIRVDVTSNISIEELRYIESSRSNVQSDGRSKNSAKVINECGKKDSDGGFNESKVIKFNGEDEDFIIRCSQLALNQKKR